MPVCTGAVRRKKPVFTWFSGINWLTLGNFLINVGAMKPKFNYSMKVPEAMVAPLERMLQFHPGCARRKELYLFVLHLVARQLRRKYRDERSIGRKVDVKTWHCNLHSVYLHMAIGAHYVGVLEDLENWGFIRRSRSYLKGDGKTPGVSKAFWFQYGYAVKWREYCWSREDAVADPDTHVKRRVGRTKTFQVTSRTFLKRLQKCAEDVKSKQLKDPMVSECHRQLEHFAIDRAQARQVLDSLVDSGEIKDVQRTTELAKVERFMSYAKDPCALFVKKDRFGRIHTNVTQLKKEVRTECLYCDGRPTVSVDIKSSQGAFLGKILRTLGEPSSILDTGSHAAVRELVLGMPTVDPGKYAEECGVYNGLLRGGRLYEHFAGRISEDPLYDGKLDRKEAKHGFFLFLFGPVVEEREPCSLRAAVRRVWERDFPVLLAVIEHLKKSDYAALARAMQCVESGFVFGRVIPRVMSEVGCPFCTVHDSVIVPSEYGDRVKALMDSELDDAGVPTMTEEERGQVFMTGAEMEFEREVLEEMSGRSPGNLPGVF